MRFIVKIALLLMLLPFPYLAGTACAYDEDKIVVGGDHENPPYEFMKEGKATGFNVELMRAVADVVGLQVEFRLGPWGEVRKELEQGKIDALAGMYYSEERSKLVDFSVFHTMVSPGLFVRDGSPIGSIEDIKGKAIIVQKGDLIDDYLHENGISPNIIEVKDPADELRLLASGRHDCALMPSRVQGEYLKRTLGIDGIKGMSTNIPQLRYCFAVRKGNGPLRYRLDEGLNILKINGKYQEIYNKWFGVYEKSRLWRTVRYFVWALAVIAGLLAASSLWSWFLRREVRKRTAELKEREESLQFTQFAIDNATDQAFWMTEDARLFYVNDAACRSLGYTREELLRLSIPDIDPIFQTERFAEHWKDLQEYGYANFETLHRHKSGRVYPVEIRANYVVFDGKEYNCAFATDISERKKAEEILRESEEKFRVLAETSPAAICVYQGENLVYLNSAMAHLTGYSEAELMGMRFWEWIHEDFRESARNRGISIQSGEPLPSRYEIKIVTKGGEEKWLLISAGRIEYKGEPAGIVTMFDNTDRKRMADELQHAYDDLEKKVVERTAELADKVDALRLSQFCIDKAGIGIFQTDENGTIFNVNEYACENLGYSREELLSLSIFDIDPEITPEKMLELKELIDEKGSLTHFTIHKRKDGSTFPVEITANNLDFRGKRYGISFVKDITKRKKAEEALRRAKEEWERTFASVPDLIAILDDQCRVLRVNEAMANRLGTKPEECIGLHCYEVIHGTSEPPPFCPHLQTMMDSRKHVVEVHEDRLGGDFLVSTIPLNDDRGIMIGSVHIAYDITERKKAEEALKESESRVRRKLDSILDPEGDIGELELADIIDTQGIQALMDDLYRNTGLKMSIIDLKGRVLVDAGWQEICKKFHRAHPETLKRCIESDTSLTEGIPPGWFRKYHCLNKMWHLVTPIMVGEKHMGNLFMGQFFFENEELDYDLFRSQARKYGFPEEEYMSALEAVPRFSEDSVNNGKAFFLRLIHMFSKLSYGNIKLARLLAERDRLTEKLRQANKVVENSPVVLFRWGGDDEWPVELVSSNIVQFGYNLQELLSGAITYSSIIHPDDLERVTREVHDICKGGGDLLRLEYRIMTKGGDARWVNELTHVERNEDGRIRNFEGVVIDVTERKLADEELKRQKQLLEDLNRTLEEKVSDEVAKNREKDFMLIQQNRQAAMGEILDHVAHQWKQPLYSISLISYLLKDNDSLKVEEINETVDKIHSQVDFLSQTLNDFREFYRPDKAKKLFQVKESMDRAFSFLMSALQFESVKVDIEIESGLTAYGYPKEFTQVILNLVGNARDVFKERKVEKPMLIVRGFAEEETAVVTVMDNAGGISEETIDSIFDMNFTTKASIGGTGIGLYMSRNIIEQRMGGILAVGNVDGGARFTIRLAGTEPLSGEKEAAGSMADNRPDSATAT